MRAVALSLLLSGCTVASRRPPPPVHRDSTIEELVRLRCASDGTEVLTTWTGTVYAYPTGEAPRRLFTITGMNVARCLRGDDGWTLTSRELMLYRAADDSATLTRWQNPWSGAEVPVMHVANRLVQARLGPVALAVADGRATAIIDVPLAYPNPLAADPAAARYSPVPLYQGGEFFTLTGPATFVGPAVPWLELTWTRIGPWLPWMDMGERPGFLLYRATGRKVASFAELPAELQALVRDRVPLYRHAPTCVVDARNVTSWTYFAAHRAEYEAGAEFPLSEPAVADCPSR